VFDAVNEIVSVGGVCEKAGVLERDRVPLTVEVGVVL
jgi:hypothetical protein